MEYDIWIPDLNLCFEFQVCNFNQIIIMYKHYWLLINSLFNYLIKMIQKKNIINYYN